MKFNKQIAIILVLGSLLLSAIGAAVYLYKENEKTKKHNEAMVTIYVAQTNLKRNTLILEKNIKSVLIAKKYLVAKPLLKKEILGSFTKIDMYKNEMFRQEKISKEKSDEIVKNLPFKYSSYNVGFSLFKNPNLSLKKGDFIDLITVYPKNKDKDNMDYKLRFVAKNIKILGFMEKGQLVENTFRQVKQKVKTKKKKEKPTYEQVTKYSDEMVLDIKPALILALLDDYNKGKQLWMVQVKEAKAKKREPKDIIKEGKLTKRVVKRIYAYKEYIPRNTSVVKVATIEYLDDKIPSQRSTSVLRTNLQKECRSTKQYLIGSSREVYLRKKASMRSKVVKKIYRNYIIPYTRKVNDTWYEVCDGSFVHKNEAVTISKKRAQGLLHGSKK